MLEDNLPKSILFVQKPEVLAGQRDEVRDYFAQHLPDCAVTFAAFGDKPRGDFDCVIGPAAPPVFEVLQDVGHLRWIHFTGAGVDAVADEMARRPEVRFTTSAGVNADAIAEYVIGGILYFAKQFHIFDGYRREQRWARHWLDELTGQKLLCLGIGAVGQAVAVRAKAFGMHVCGMARQIKDVPGFDEIILADAMDAALVRADVIVCALPYTPETHHLLGREAFSRMKKNSLLVNVARGGIVDTAALMQALKGATIKGAVLDVFEQEPLPPDSPLWDMQNVLLTPHVSGTTNLYLRRMLDIFLRKCNLRSV